jgi:multidrug resistance efflux pump
VILIVTKIYIKSYYHKTTIRTSFSYKTRSRVSTLQQEKSNSFQTSVIKQREKCQTNKELQQLILKSKAMLETAKLNLTYTVITAAIDGQVSKIDIQPGQLVQPGQSLFYISTIRRLG